MAVIVRESRMIGGKEYPNVKVYKSTTLVTGEARKKAEHLDQLLSRRMKRIESEMRKRGLLAKRGKPGVLRLWCEVGKMLTFVDEIEVEPAEDRKYVWRALYDHAGELRPSEPGQRASEFIRNHFRQCYELAKISWNFVREAGTWSAWKDFFENRRVREDDRIIRWLIQKSKISPTTQRKNWLRKLTRGVNSRFLKRDTTVLTYDELMEELDEIHTEVLRSG